MINTDVISRQFLQFCSFRGENYLAWEHFQEFITSIGVTYDSELLKEHYRENAELQLSVDNNRLFFEKSGQSVEIDLENSLSQKMQILRKGLQQNA